ncbi:unnamed protein product [Soboliphyme baturini]|uniref:Acyl-CoA_dh_1 domain-containing protein n=1 Tax=Soboliphyme baturini TaxID=241478 RepID=A0A183IAK9_9BILA|nr:unnamed protein product [Soboliphyme baturini]
MNIYALETMAFYIAGYLDEQPSKDFTVEASIAMLYARRALKNGIVSFMDLFGASATTTNMELERLLRDITTLNAFLNTDDWLVGQISMAGIIAWAKDQSIDLQ